MNGYNDADKISQIALAIMFMLGAGITADVHLYWVPISMLTIALFLGIGALGL